MHLMGHACLRRGKKLYREGKDQFVQLFLIVISFHLFTITSIILTNYFDGFEILCTFNSF